MSTARPSRRKTGCRRPRRPSRPRERGATDRGEAVAHRLALVTLGATSVLILLGGLVTNTGAALAVPLRGADPAVRRVAFAAAAAVYLQIVFGALLTHAGWLWLHVGGALAVFAVVPSVTARLRGTGDPVAAPIARVLLVLLGLQLLLGVGTFLARFTAIWIPGGQTTPLVLPVAHRLVG